MKTYHSKYLLGDIVVINGDEYLVVDIEWNNDLRPVRLYTIDDGSKWTVNQLSVKIGSTGTCARARLNASTDPKRIFAPIRRISGDDKRNIIFDKDLIDSKKWYKDPLVKLMLKG
jgi:hypothetical protein